MEQTANLNLSYIMAGQAQKHVTHNEAIRQLDAVVQAAVLTRTLSAPPQSLAEGEAYLVADEATGAWAGHENELAAWQDNAWMFYTPRPGWRIWVIDEVLLRAWDGSAWIVVGGGDTGQLNIFENVGIQTDADNTNRLAVKSDAILFSHDDVTPGSGDLQCKLNKASTSNTASILFQDDWAGRAEIGLTGDDNLHTKVSADGTNWQDAWLVDQTTGHTRFPALLSPAAGLSDGQPVIRTSSDVAVQVPADFSDIQQALDAMGGYYFEGDAVGRVVLAPGIYQISSPLKFSHAQKKRIILTGDNSTAPDAADFTGDKAADEIMVRSKYPVVIECDDCHGVTLDAMEGVGKISDIAFIRTAGTATRYGLIAENVSFAELRSCCFFGFSYGLYVTNKAFLSVTNVVSAHGAIYGLYLADGAYVTGAVFLSTYSGSHGIFLKSSQIKLSSSEVGHNDGVGVMASYGSEINLVGCQVIANDSHGVMMQYGGLSTLINQNLADNDGFGVLLRTGVIGFIQNLSVSGPNLSRTVKAEGNSTVSELGTHTGLPIWSPAIGTEGNEGSWMI